MNATGDLGWLDSPAALESTVERLRAVTSLGLDAGRFTPFCMIFFFLDGFLRA